MLYVDAVRIFAWTLSGKSVFLAQAWPTVAYLNLCIFKSGHRIKLLTYEGCRENSHQFWTLGIMLCCPIASNYYSLSVSTLYRWRDWVSSFYMFSHRYNRKMRKNWENEEKILLSLITYICFSASSHEFHVTQNNRKIVSSF